MSKAKGMICAHLTILTGNQDPSAKHQARGGAVGAACLNTPTYLCKVTWLVLPFWHVPAGLLYWSTETTYIVLQYRLLLWFSLHYLICPLLGTALASKVGRAHFLRYRFPLGLRLEEDCTLCPLLSILGPEIDYTRLVNTRARVQSSTGNYRP